MSILGSLGNYIRKGQKEQKLSDKVSSQSRNVLFLPK
jgi:hypothetical protein